MSTPKQGVYTKRLDRTKPYGEVHPAGTDGVHFEQGGYPFDNEGFIVDGALTSAQRAALLKPPAKPTTKPAPPPPSAEAEEETAADTSDDLNLELWAKGEAQYDFPEVQAAVKARLHKWCTSKVDLVNFLVDENVVAKSQLAPAFLKMIEAAEK